MRGNVLLLDVRPAVEFGICHLPEAHNVPYKSQPQWGEETAAKIAVLLGMFVLAGYRSGCVQETHLCSTHSPPKTLYVKSGVFPHRWLWCVGAGMTLSWL